MRAASLLASVVLAGQTLFATNLHATGETFEIVGGSGSLLQATTVAEFDEPWAMAFLPDETMLVTTKPGKLFYVTQEGNKTEVEDIEDFVRTTLYSHLTPHPYRDIELHDVDRKLKRYNLMNYDKLCNVSAKRLGRILRADAIVIGEVTEFQRVYAGIYSQMAVGASITIWDTRTGKKLWSDEHVTRNHEGGIPLAITDLALISIRSGLNLTDAEKVKTVDELSRHLISRVPVPNPQGSDRSTTPLPSAARS